MSKVCYILNVVFWENTNEGKYWVLKVNIETLAFML